ncbi:hypothetical protein, partial [Siphonobacter sp. BAB-5405]|uniref:hypothetical protein n=1 Tax=Siphonobacter sp. BAB-5405 TaxID=1864825 RepID=UPI0013048A93
LCHDGPLVRRLQPEAFDVQRIGPIAGDLPTTTWITPTRWEPTTTGFAEGLRKSLFNYMHGVCFEFPLQEWFRSFG